MAAMRQGRLTIAGADGAANREIAYTDWGDASNPDILVCTHGLTRNSRDFDVFARAMADTYRVVCPDAAGRGESGWLPTPEAYGYPRYVADTQALLAHLGAAQVDWVGTSMGGLLGMLAATLPDAPIRRLVINDIGPFIPKESLKRIDGYLALAPGRQFADLDAAEAYLRDAHAPFGPLTDAEWRHLAEHSTRPAEDGRLRLHFDPAIAAGFHAAIGDDVDLWEVWDQVPCSVLVLHGVSSDVLPAGIARAMTERGPRTTVMDIAECGHAPALMADDQIALVRRWLAEAPVETS